MVFMIFHEISWKSMAFHIFPLAFMHLRGPQPLWNLKYLSDINGSGRGWRAWWRRGQRGWNLGKFSEVSLNSWNSMKFHETSWIYTIFRETSCNVTTIRENSSEEERWTLHVLLPTRMDPARGRIRKQRFSGTLRAGVNFGVIGTKNSFLKPKSRFLHQKWFLH